MSKIGIFMADGCEEIEGLTVVDIVRRANRNSLLSAIEIRADSSSDIGFARLCSIAGAQVSAARKSYELSRGVRTCPTGVFQTWKDTDHRRCSRRLVRNATFFEQNVPDAVPSEICIRYFL